MKTIVDTSVWSLAFRKRILSDYELSVVNTLIALMQSKEIVIIGAVRQEALSGISDERRFEIIKNKLEPFPDFPVFTQDYITAARFFNTCRTHGVQGSHIDFLISAVAANNGFAILTLDNDFSRYAQFINLSLVTL